LAGAAHCSIEERLDFENYAERASKKLERAALDLLCAVYNDNRCREVVSQAIRDYRALKSDKRVSDNLEAILLSATALADVLDEVPRESSVYTGALVAAKQRFRKCTRKAVLALAPVRNWLPAPGLACYFPYEQIQQLYKAAPWSLDGELAQRFSQAKSDVCVLLAQAETLLVSAPIARFGFACVALIGAFYVHMDGLAKDPAWKPWLKVDWFARDTPEYLAPETQGLQELAQEMWVLLESRLTGEAARARSDAGQEAGLGLSSAPPSTTDDPTEARRDASRYYLSARYEVRTPTYVNGEVVGTDKDHTTTYFYRTEDKAVANKLIKLFAAKLSGRTVDAEEYGRNSLIEMGNAEFGWQPASAFGDTDRFLLDEEIDKVETEVARYLADWQVDCLECGEPPWVHNAYDPPLYNEEHPLSVASLNHRAQEWEARLRPQEPLLDEDASAMSFAPGHAGADQSNGRGSGGDTSQSKTEGERFWDTFTLFFDGKDGRYKLRERTGDRPRKTNAVEIGRSDVLKNLLDALLAAGKSGIITHAQVRQARSAGPLRREESLDHPGPGGQGKIPKADLNADKVANRQHISTLRKKLVEAVKSINPNPPDPLPKKTDNGWTWLFHVTTKPYPDR